MKPRQEEPAGHDPIPTPQRAVESVSSKPLLFVVVDTEEEFDWGAPFSRQNDSVSAMKWVHRGQEVFNRFGLRPAYVVDYPVASKPDGYLPLRDIFTDRACTIGAHLHPWVTPPHDEDVNGHNSFTCNLPVPLQRAKLQRLCDVIGENLLTTPRVFKAGRYGLGKATVDTLDALGFTIDNSVSPKFDFSAQGGPDYRKFDSQPFFLTRNLLEVPCTIDFVGWAGRWKPALHALGGNPRLSAFRVPAVLSRSGAVERIMLSPEGNTFEEMRTLTRALFSRGQRTFTLSFHSPSLDVGHTPYVRTSHDLHNFQDRIARYCEFFMTELGGQPGELEAFRHSVTNTLNGV